MRFVLLLVAAVIAVVAGVAALKFTGGAQENKQPTTASSPVQKTANVTTVEVLVARAQINVGDVISDEMIARQPWPSHLVLESFIVADNEGGNIIGHVARATFMPQEPLLKSRIGNPNDPSFLAAALPQGMRAVTMGTDTVAGVAGYVFPGDRVDVLMTHNVPSETIIRRNTGNPSYVTSNKPAYSEVLIANARVLAVNLRDADVRESARSTIAPSSITLELPEEVVQQVRLAEKLGTLSLSLRSLKDIDNHQTPAPTSLENLTRVEMSQSGVVGGVRLVRGAQSDSEVQDQVQRAVRNEMNPTLGTSASGDGQTQ